MKIQNVLVFPHVCLVKMMKKWEGKYILLICPYWNLKQWDSKGNFKISCSWPFFHIFSCLFRGKKKKRQTQAENPPISPFSFLFFFPTKQGRISFSSSFSSFLPPYFPFSPQSNATLPKKYLFIFIFYFYRSEERRVGKECW